MQPVRHQRPVTGIAFLAGMLALLLPALPARAENPQVNANFFRPAVHPDSILNVETTLMPAPMAWGVGAFFSYETRSLRLEDQSGTSVYQILRDVVKADVYGHFAPTRWLDIGLDLPLFLFERGDTPPAVVPLSQVKGTSLGDLRLGLKFRALGGNGEGFGLAVTEDLTFPTASARALGGDRYVTSTTLLVGGYNRRGWDVALNAGVRLKAPVKFLDTETGHQLLLGLGLSAPLICGRLEAIGTIETRTQLTAPFQSSQHDALEMMAGLRGRVGPVVLTAAGGGGVLSGFGSPLGRALISVAYAPPLERGCVSDGEREERRLERREERPAPAAAVGKAPSPKPAPASTPAAKAPVGVAAPVAPAGPATDRDRDGIADTVDACPDVPGVASPSPRRNGCPSDRDEDGFPDTVDACPDLAGVANPDARFNGCPPDRDGDGVIDALDVCPDEPGSDFSGPDRLGCQPDRDDDGILDFLDACPDVFGVKQADPTLNGCPVYTAHRKVEFPGPVEFDVDKSTLRPDALTILDRVARILDEHPEIRQVRIEGHTDNHFGLAHGVRLSRARAEAVRDYLVRKGVAASRLVTEGYADMRPKASNDTEAGRQANRRVEFLILGP